VAGDAQLPVEAVQRRDIEAAAARIEGLIRRTPVLHVEADAFGTPVPLDLKLDMLQPTGSFKVRGATSLLTAIDVPAAGVVAASGGNFGQAVAWAARRLGHRAHVFVPATSPAEKIAPIRDLGAEVHVIDGYYHEALRAAEEHVADSGAAWAHAYDQPEVVAGQGTVARELLEDVARLDTILVACGGGGLLAGVAGWVQDEVRVVAVETEETPTLHAALEAGQPVDVEVSGLAASSLGARRLGAHAWAARAWVDRNLLVTDEQVAGAQLALWRGCRLVAEPGGATALAAILSDAYVPGPGERVAVLVCGANTDAASLAATPQPTPMHD
jgi:threonine dehydratase